MLYEEDATMWRAPNEKEFVTMSLNKVEVNSKHFYYTTTKLPSILNGILYLKSDINF